MSIFRRVSLPDDVRRRLSLDRGDHVLASAELLGGGWSVATRTSLLVLAEPEVRRAWSDVDRAAFDPRAGAVTVEWVDDEPPLVLTFASPDRSELPQVLRERVQSSVVIGETVELPGGRHARVAVRRGPDGGLFSQVSIDPGVDLGDPDVAGRVDAAEARVRSASGLPL